MTNVAGILWLPILRNAIFTSLAKFAENVWFGSAGPAERSGLSERSLAASALFLASNLAAAGACCLRTWIRRRWVR
ncbi:hypothetical protein B0H17DRAFT_1194703 [Mycena rosella]|uniref:Uncharacterized protein n=1 Tax=Mycena rosella TaxID=1033263 RepID=A0AAD7GMW9_MYCRO|nr:hypothetical protein B0H17DRAFT_1194703 [Mycena rosella]